MMPLWVGTWTRRLLPYGVGLVLCIAGALAARSAWRGQWQRGWEAALQEAAAIAPQQRDTVRIAVARTDTIVRVVTQQAKRVRDVGDRVPDTVLVRFPVVDTLRIESRALADSLPKLLTVVQTERTAHERLQLSTAKIVVAKSDTIATLRKRPTRTLTALLMTTTGLAAYLLGTR